ncbi:MAG: OmpA family protein [Pseudomonadota bacterium]
MVLTLGDVLFDTGQATLKPGAASTIDRLGTFLTEANDRSVVIEGHTDSTGSQGTNQSLSESRCQCREGGAGGEEHRTGSHRDRGQGCGSAGGHQRYVSGSSAERREWRSSSPTRLRSKVADRL